MSLPVKIATFLIVVGLAVALAGQAVVDATVPSGIADTGRLLGRAGFGYVSGLRTFAAAVLWNRLDDQFHEYYGGELDRSAFMLPTIRMVTWLDPQFVQAYYVGPWIVMRSGYDEEGWELAREGVETNPRSGLLRAQLAQFDFIDGEVDEAEVHARIGIGDVDWTSPVEQHDAYAIFREVFEATGNETLLAHVEAELRRLDAEIEALHGAGLLDELHQEHDHDHDHDHGGE